MRRNVQGFDRHIALENLQSQLQRRRKAAAHLLPNQQAMSNPPC